MRLLERHVLQRRVVVQLSANGRGIGWSLGVRCVFVCEPMSVVWCMRVFVHLSANGQYSFVYSDCGHWVSSVCVCVCVCACERVGVSLQMSRAFCIHKFHFVVIGRLVCVPVT